MTKKVFIVVLACCLARTGIASAVEVCAIGHGAVVEAKIDERHALLSIQKNEVGEAVSVASIETLDQNSAMHKLVVHGRYVIAQLWKNLEIYDFSNPMKPKLVRQLELNDPESPWVAFGVLQEKNKLTYFGEKGATEVNLTNTVSEWTLTYLQSSPDLQRRRINATNYNSRLQDPADKLGGAPRTISLLGGEFEVVWEGGQLEVGLIQFRQYLRSLGAEYRLLIDTIDETID